MGWCFCQERRRRFLRVRQGRNLFCIPICSSSLFSLHNNSTIYHCALIAEEVRRGRNDKLTDFCFVFLQLRYGKTLTCSAYTPKSCTYSKPSQRGQSERLYRTAYSEDDTKIGAFGFCGAKKQSRASGTHNPSPHNEGGGGGGGGSDRPSRE